VRSRSAIHSPACRPTWAGSSPATDQGTPPRSRFEHDHAPACLQGGTQRGDGALQHLAGHTHGALPTAFTAAGAQAASSARTGSPTRIRGSRLAQACIGSSGPGTREPAPKGAQPCAMTARPSRKSPPPSM
jgi:hypothetical protein